MKIGMIGSEKLAQELRSLPGIKGEFTSFSNWEEIKQGNFSFDLFFLFTDLNTLPPEAISFFANSVGSLGLNSIFGSSLYQIQSTSELSGTVFGFLGLGGFLNRKSWEVGFSKKEFSKTHLDRIKEFGIEPIQVLDRVGLVSGRVLGMIMNEAYYTVMEGTAKKEDIDLAMKMGTNYPKGPFEMVKLAGRVELLCLLDHLFQETHDERYKACPLLREEAYQANLT